MKTNPLYHMNKTLLAANWKSNKTKFEAKDWLLEISSFEVSENLEIVIFPPFTLLDNLSGYVKVNSLPFKMGSQDISPYDSGPYTGEINAHQIKEFAQYVLIGHSERRTNFSESNEIINQKIEKAISSDLIPIVCVSSLEQIESINTDKKIILAYEPIDAIGTGNPESPDKVKEFISNIKSNREYDIIYGGSVNADNIKSYLEIPGISGSLIGGESLDSSSFLKIIKNAS